MMEIHVQSGGSLELYPEGERVAKADERYTVRGCFVCGTVRYMPLRKRSTCC